jgi:hypothetical protein
VCIIQFRSFQTFLPPFPLWLSQEGAQGRRRSARVAWKISLKTKEIADNKIRHIECPVSIGMVGDGLSTVSHLFCSSLHPATCCKRFLIPKHIPATVDIIIGVFA